jgi:hypothetical protein
LYFFFKFQKITSIVSHAPTFDRSQTNNSTQLQNNNHRQNGLSNRNTNSTQIAKGQLKRFVVVRFNYTKSEAVAEFFPHMGCKCYQVREFFVQNLNLVIFRFRRIFRGW